jgi:NitT/TauT family transport system ATP-binding protein
VRLRCESLAFSYSNSAVDEAVFSSLALDLREFSSLALLGPSGCGKTTLLKILGGALVPQSGHFSLTDNNGILVRTGYLAQEPALLPWLSVSGNLSLAERLRGDGQSNSLVQDERRRLASLFGLSAHLSRRPSDLSGGMKQRAALVNALTSRSNMLLLDEPFSGSDSLSRNAMHDALREFSSPEAGGSVIFISHDATDVIALADTVVVLGASADFVPRVIDARGGWRRREKSLLAQMMLGSAIL